MRKSGEKGWILMSGLFLVSKQG